MSYSPNAYEIALARLPDTYAMALRCVDSGMSDAQICSTLGIEPEVLEPLVDMAERKLRTELTRT